MTDKRTEAARQFSEAVGFAHAPEHMDMTECPSRAEWLAAYGPSWDAPASPQWWANALATETAERQGWAGMRGAGMLLVASANNLRTLEAAADDLPLLQWPNVEPWPKGRPLPDNWREGLFMRKSDLREWAKTHAPHLLGSALLAEPESAPDAEAATVAGPGTAAPVWQAKAREIAQSHWDKYKAMDLQGKLDSYAEHVEAELRRLKITGPRGEFLSAGTIKREALQGAQWWQKRKL